MQKGMMDYLHLTKADLDDLPKPAFSEIDGLLFPPFVRKERMAVIPEAVVRNDDVYVISYPKCGTTWTQEIVWQVLNDGELSELFLDARFSFYEVGTWQLKTGKYTTQSEAQAALDALPSPRLLKTHLPFHLIPLQLSSGPFKCKIIYVMRNPKDAAVSQYHQIKSFLAYNYEGTLDQFLPLYMAGKVDYGSYYDHVLGWWSHKDDPNILFVKYEDMKENLSGSVSRIAEFLGKSLATETVQKIAKQCSFKAMKANTATNRSQWNRSTKSGTCTFMRKGEVGDWKNFFTDEQSKAFDEQYADRMKGSGLSF